MADREAGLKLIEELPEPVRVRVMAMEAARISAGLEATMRQISRDVGATAEQLAALCKAAGASDV